MWKIGLNQTLLIPLSLVSNDLRETLHEMNGLSAICFRSCPIFFLHNGILPTAWCSGGSFHPPPPIYWCGFKELWNETLQGCWFFLGGGDTAIILPSHSLFWNNARPERLWGEMVTVRRRLLPKIKQNNLSLLWNFSGYKKKWKKSIQIIQAYRWAYVNEWGVMKMDSVCCEKKCF